MKSLGFSRIGRMYAGRVYDWVRKNHPAALRANMALRKKRDETENQLRQLGDAGTSSGPSVGTVLIDAMWDNPNYWLRLATVRAALGSRAGREVGLIGTFRESFVSRTLSNLGIANSISWAAFSPNRAEVCAQAASLCQKTSAPGDILEWDLPFGFPAELVYDGILKRQRQASVNTKDPMFPSHVEDALIAILTADSIVGTVEPDHLILSHALNFDFGALAWAAIRRNMAVTVTFGLFGVARFIKLTCPEDLFDQMDFPEGAVLDSLKPDALENLAALGKQNIPARIRGETNDIGAQFAFGTRETALDRKQIRKAYGWTDERPVIAVYAANWFDFPHFFGMRNFRDFLDWLEMTINAARNNSDVNWLFKPHPCDAWYGGVTLADLMGTDQSDNIAMVPDGWNSADLLMAIDGLVTVHSTGAVEAAALGKPVLVADRGWYHACGFVRWAQSRSAYLEALATPWWEQHDIRSTTYRARMFAGLYFGKPDWQGGFITDDDSLQDKLYDSMPTLLADNASAIDREIDTLREWFARPDRRYHTFKMLREAASFAE
jgi:hypothetical protein